MSLERSSNKDPGQAVPIEGQSLLIKSRPRLDMHNWLIRRLQDVINGAHETIITHGQTAYRLDSQDLPHGAGLKYLRMMQAETKRELKWAKKWGEQAGQSGVEAIEQTEKCELVGTVVLDGDKNPPENLPGFFDEGSVAGEPSGEPDKDAEG